MWRYACTNKLLLVKSLGIPEIRINGSTCSSLLDLGPKMMYCSFVNDNCYAGILYILYLSIYIYTMYIYIYTCIHLYIYHLMCIYIYIMHDPL